MATFVLSPESPFFRNFKALILPKLLENLVVLYGFKVVCFLNLPVWLRDALGIFRASGWVHIDTEVSQGLPLMILKKMGGEHNDHMPLPATDPTAVKPFKGPWKIG